METKKTTTITEEVHELVVVKRTSQHPVRAWCRECNGDVEMLTPDEAAAIAKVNTRTIYRWIEAGEMHHVETASGSTLVCSHALFRLHGFS